MSTQHKPTEEQQAILDAAATGGTVAISARAGTGKTTTLRMVAEARPRTRMLYVAFNKAIQLEADKTFPANVTCNTAHALAFREFGMPLGAGHARAARTGRAAPAAQTPPLGLASVGEPGLTYRSRGVTPGHGGNRPAAFRPLAGALAHLRRATGLDHLADQRRRRRVAGRAGTGRPYGDVDRPRRWSYNPGRTGSRVAGRAQ